MMKDFILHKTNEDSFTKKIELEADKDGNRAALKAELEEIIGNVLMLIKDKRRDDAVKVLDGLDMCIHLMQVAVMEAAYEQGVKDGVQLISDIRVWAGA